MPDNDNLAAPIVVPANPLPAALATLVRQAIIAVCGIAVARGWFGQDVADQLVPIGIGLAAIIYGQVKGWVLQRTAATMATILPDSIATTK